MRGSKQKDTAGWWRDHSEVLDMVNGIYENVEVTDGSYKGWFIVIYPVFKKQQEDSDQKEIDGYEYTLFPPEDSKIEDSWDSLLETSNGNDHAETIELAKEWAIGTIDNWVYD